ncbi:MAG: gliding motility lipoprotein GldH [Bacteroidales bacterium]
MKRVFVLFSILLIISQLYLSCDSTMVYNEFQHIENNTWKWEEPAEFNFSIDDTASFHNILVQVRHTTAYPLSNLFMFVHVEGPTGQTMTDTIQFMLAETSGKWIGNGVGNMRALGYLYKKNTLFPEPGDYHITIEQAMRLPQVPVSEVGLKVEKINP